MCVLRPTHNFNCVASIYQLSISNLPQHYYNVFATLDDLPFIFISSKNIFDCRNRKMSCTNCQYCGSNSGGAFPIQLPPLMSMASCCFGGRVGSGQSSRGESALESEALAAVQQLAIAVQSIAVSEMLPRTQDLIFVNLTTLEGYFY